MKVFYDVARAQAAKLSVVHTIDGETLLATNGQHVRPGDWAYDLTQGSLDHRSNRRSRGNVLANRNRVYLNMRTGSLQMGPVAGAHVNTSKFPVHLSLGNATTGIKWVEHWSKMGLLPPSVTSYTLAGLDAASGRKFAESFGAILGTVVLPRPHTVPTPNTNIAAWVMQCLPIGYGLVARGLDGLPTPNSDSPYLVYHGGPYKFTILKNTYGDYRAFTYGKIDGVYTISHTWNRVVTPGPEGEPDTVVRGEGFRNWLSMLTSMGIPTRSVESMYDEGVQLDPDASVPRTFQDGFWIPTELMTHGTLSIPTGRVSVEPLEDDISWEEILLRYPRNQWYGHKGTGDYHGVLPPDAIAGLLRGSVDHDRFGASIEAHESQELRKAAEEVEASDLHLNFQMMQQGVTARRFQSWAEGASDLKDSEILSKRPLYTIGDFNRKWVGKREYFFVSASTISEDAPPNATVLEGPTDSSIARYVRWEPMPDVVLTTATAEGRLGIADLVANSEHELVMLDADEAVKADDIFEMYDELKDHRVSIVDGNQATPSVLNPPFFRSVPMDTDAERFLTLKGGQDDEMLRMALNVLEAERALLGGVFND